MIGPDQRQAIPPAIEREFDTVRGTLRCSKCGFIFGLAGSEYKRGQFVGDAQYYEVNVTNTPRNHRCSKDNAIHRSTLDYLLREGVSFPYDWDSPLTIKQQLANYLKGQGHEIEAADAEDLKYLRCSGFRVFPDGSPCIGCPDCDTQQPTKSASIERKPRTIERKRTMFDD